MKVQSYNSANQTQFKRKVFIGNNKKLEKSLIEQHPQYKITNDGYFIWGKDLTKYVKDSLANATKFLEDEEWTQSMKKAADAMKNKKAKNK